MSAFSNALQFLYQSLFSPLQCHCRGEEAGSKSDGSDSSGGGKGDNIGNNSDNENDDDGNFGHNNNGDGVAEALIMGWGPVTAVQWGESWWRW